MELDFYQTLYRQILRLKGRIAFHSVVFAATILEHLSDKKDSKTIYYNQLTITLYSNLLCSSIYSGD